MTDFAASQTALDRHVQLNEQDRLQHFLDLHDLSQHHLSEILEKANTFIDAKSSNVISNPILRNKTIANIFFEASTRTRTTFELAAKKLGADILNLNISTSATSKGESLLDTMKNLEAMQCDMFVIRHSDSGAAYFLAQHVAPHVSVVNAGDGQHAHPTQALLDVFTIQRHKQNFQNLRVAIVGDILHSRVARSQIQALKALNTGEIHVIGPHTLLPADIEKSGVSVFHDIKKGIKDCDVIIMLRLQKERMQGALLPSEQEYFRFYGLTNERLALAKEDAIVMHPGPANRGVEIASDVADGPRSVILEQVTVGIAIRMAVMSTVLSNRQNLTT